MNNTTNKATGEALGLNKSRAEFEAWLSPHWSAEKQTEDDGEVTYVDDLTQGAWIGWCGALARAGTAAPAAPTTELKYTDAEMAQAHTQGYELGMKQKREALLSEVAPAAAVLPSEQTVSLNEPGAMIFGELNSMDTKMNDIQCVASNSLMQRALTLAMEICDAVPSRAHEAPEGDPLRSIGALVNYQEATGMYGYAVIRDALEFISRDADASEASDAASWLPTVDAVNVLPKGVRQYVQQLEAEVNRRPGVHPDIKLLHEIDALLRNEEINDPDPIKPVMQGVTITTTTYGLVAGLLREVKFLRKHCPTFGEEPE